jgi:hypothetical protein
LEDGEGLDELAFGFEDAGAPDSVGATDYYSLCEEVIERVEARTT